MHRSRAPRVLPGARWAMRTAFYLLAAAAFVCSITLLVVRYRQAQAEQAAWDAGLDAERGQRDGGDDGGPLGEDPAEVAFRGEQFKQWVNGLLNISVPIILSKRSLHSHEAFSCGGSHVVKFKVYKDLKAFSHLADVLPDKDLLTTPGHPEMKKYDSCAVVGNSGSLLETQYGDMIDNHDVVIRFNAAKTEGYEQFVGYKTTFRLLNSVEKQLASDANEAGITTLRNSDMKEWVKATMASGNSATSLATDPEFLCHTWAWVHNRGDKPSSGLVGIVMALKMCRTLDIYGFQYSNYFSRFSRPHYYDWERPKKGREKVHPFMREVSLYAQLAKHGYLTVW